MANTPEPSATEQELWCDLGSLLDEALSRLADKYRVVIVLCDLEGKTRKEAARQLGCPEGTVAGRLARARAMLAKRLAQRGVTMSGGALAAALAEQAASAGAPNSVVEATIRAASLFAKGKAAANGVISVKVAALTQGMLKAMLYSKLRTAALVVLILGIVATGALFMHAAVSVGADATRKEPQTNRRGDALPPGAVARLGTVQLRTRGGSPWILYRASPGIAFLPGDKDVMALGGGIVDFLDVATGNATRCLEKPPWKWVYSLSPDGKTVLGYVGNGEAHLWEATTGKELCQLTTKEGWLESAVFSGDGRTLVAANKPQGEVFIWEVPGGKEIRRFKELHGVIAVGVAADGKILATADWASSSTIRIRETTTGKELGNFEANGQIHQLTFSADGKTLAAVEPCDGASNVHLWDVAGGKLRRSLPMKEFLEGAAFSPDGKLLATAHRESFHVWDQATGERLKRFEGNGCFAIDLAFSSDGKMLATAGDSAVRLWDVTTGKEITVSGVGHLGTVETLSFQANGKTLVSVGADHTLRRWESATGKLVDRFPIAGQTRSPHCFALGTGLLALGVEKEVIVYDVNTGKELRRFSYPARVRHAALTPDGKALAVFVGGEDQTLRLVDPATGKVRLKRQSPDVVQSLAMSPDGSVLAAGLANGTCLLLDCLTNKEIRRLPVSETVTTFTFSLDSKTLATAEANGVMRLWETATGKERAQLPDRNCDVMTFSPDGRVLAIVDRLGAIRLCVTATGKELRALSGHRNAITCLSFSPDGKRLASGSRDTTVLIWDVSGLPKSQEVDGELGRRQLEALWTDLAGDDAVRAYKAVHRLAGVPGQTVSFLKEHLRPVPMLEPKKVARLLADLDSDEFTVREKATAELDKLGGAVEPSLRAALEQKLPLEAERRVRRLLARWDRPFSDGERLHEIRALEVLEQIGNAEARKLLTVLSLGAPGTRLTLDARASLDRGR
jgi:WD40 repeat protein